MKHETTSETSSLQPLAQSSSGAIDTATLELLSKWKHDDATRNPEELRAAEHELSEFKRTMNESRAHSGEPLLFP